MGQSRIQFPLPVSGCTIIRSDSRQASMLNKHARMHFKSPRHSICAAIRGLHTSLWLFVGIMCFTPLTGRAQECSVLPDAVEQQQVAKKVLMLQTVVGTTAPAKRVIESSNELAIALLQQSRELAQLAEKSLSDNCIQEAGKLATEGIQKATRSFSLANDPTSNNQETYNELLRRTMSFMDSLAAIPVDRQGMGTDDFSNMQRQIDRSTIFAEEKNFSEAINLLSPVADRMERRLSQLLDRQTLIYALDFQSVEEEFNYTAEQYRGYRLLLELAQQQRNTPFSSTDRYAELEREGTQFKVKADALAAEQQWPEALENMRQAIENMEKILRVYGVYY